jgi:hypothetical protein
VGRTGIYACGESVSRRNSLESVALFSLKQEAPASIGGSTFTVNPLLFRFLGYGFDDFGMRTGCGPDLDFLVAAAGTFH